jgi:hypothetical protein
MAYRITRLAVQGFKSIATRQNIDIAPLTILAGANSFGKSSIMQPLLLLKQTLDTIYDPGALNIGGENVKFTEAKQFLSQQNERQELDLEIGVGGNASLGITFEKTTPTSALDVVEQRWTDDDQTSKLRSDSPRVSRDRFWLRPASAEDPAARLKAHVRERVPPISFLDRLIREVIQVPGLRGRRERLYPVANTGPMFPGTFTITTPV